MPVRCRDFMLWGAEMQLTLGWETAIRTPSPFHDPLVVVCMAKGNEEKYFSLMVWPVRGAWDLYSE